MENATTRVKKGDGGRERWESINLTVGKGFLEASLRTRQKKKTTGRQKNLMGVSKSSPKVPLGRGEPGQCDKSCQERRARQQMGEWRSENLGKKSESKLY